MGLTLLLQILESNIDIKGVTALYRFYGERELLEIKTVVYETNILRIE